MHLPYLDLGLPNVIIHTVTRASLTRDGLRLPRFHDCLCEMEQCFPFCLPHCPMLKQCINIREMVAVVLPENDANSQILIKDIIPLRLLQKVQGIFPFPPLWAIPGGNR